MPSVRRCPLESKKTPADTDAEQFRHLRQLLDYLGSRGFRIISIHVISISDSLDAVSLLVERV